MQTPKSRRGTISPTSITCEVSQKDSLQAELSRKSPTRVAHQIKTSPRYAEPTVSSCNLATRSPKEASPKVSDRCSSRSPLSEKKGLSRVVELESQISQLKNDLKTAKDTEISRKQAGKDEDDSSVLASALHEIERLKARLEMVSESEATIARSFVEDMESQLKVSQTSEARSKQLVAETLAQLETAKRTVESLRHDDVALELERLKCESGQREAELEAELRKSRYVFEEMRANVMDNENDLQGMCDENDVLITRAEDLKNELKNKERKIEDLLAENERGNKKAGRVMEELEAAQRANAEMEVELRKMKVHSDQWRKAAEVAAAMVAAAGGDVRSVGRTESMDYGPRMRRMSSPYSDEEIDDLMRRRNGNVLRRFGVLWKKQQK